MNLNRRLTLNKHSSLLISRKFVWVIENSTSVTYLWIQPALIVKTTPYVAAEIPHPNQLGKSPIRFRRITFRLVVSILQKWILRRAGETGDKTPAEVGTGDVEAASLTHLHGVEVLVEEVGAGVVHRQPDGDLVPLGETQDLFPIPVSWRSLTRIVQYVCRCLIF